MKKKQNKWLDNFGKADNANESHVSLPEDFNGLAYDTTGRNYSPAWGGQFQQGGSIPGTTGFTYARTGSTPSEGKYAKKTLPSAQTGITSPLLLTNKILEYFNPRKETIEEEIVPIVEQSAEYKKGLTNELLRRQAYKESTFNPAAVSPKGYKGLAQVGEDVIKDYIKKKEKKKLDPFKPEEALELQRFAMEDLYNSSFIDKPNQSDSVRIAKTLAAYNWGRGNLFDYLGQQKSKGIDIYNSYDWLKDLPKETSDYVNKILLQEDDSFNKNYQKAITNPKYKDISSMYEQKEYGGMIPIAQNGREMQFYQEGLDWKPKNISRDGSIIKDNQGYWNPDNWGKPVEIDSNEITMMPNPYTGVEVPYDVLAISNKGDVQYMEPGNNYKFKGERVLEIPMARLGINQLDAQPKKKLNQLLNFTNNPDKTNWLDKYQ
jgi:hypothetical protein